MNKEERYENKKDSAMLLSGVLALSTLAGCGAAEAPRPPPEDLPLTLPLKAALPETAAPQAHPEILRY